MGSNEPKSVDAVDAAAHAPAPRRAPLRADGKRPLPDAPTADPRADALARHIIDAAGVLLAFVGQDERYLLANRAHESWLGVPADSLTGLHVRAVFGGDVHAVLQPHIRTALTGQTSRAAATVCWPDGANRWVAIEATPHVRGDGSVEGVVLRIVDIDRHTRARQDLPASERDLADLLENAAEAMHWIDPDGIIQWVNRAQLDLLGYDRDQYVGRHVSELFVDREVAEDFVARTSRCERLSDHEARLLCRDGSIKHVLVNTNCVVESGRFVQTRCFIRDITERRIAELLQSLEKRILEQVAQDEPLGRVLATLTHHVERLAPDLEISLILFDSGTPRLAVEATWQLPADLLRSVGERRELVITSDVAADPAWEPWRAEALAAGVRACWYSPIVSSHNAVLGTLAIHCRQARSPTWRDLMLLASASHVASIAIERHLLAKERAALLAREQAARLSTEKLADSLDQALRARDDFLSMASHELRNPINTMQLQLVSVLRSAESAPEPVPAWAVARLKKATVQIRRLVRLIDNLMDVSRMTTGRMELELEPLDLETVIREVVERSREEIGDVPIITRTVPAVGTWDKLRLDQVVTNLLSNALKYGKGRPVEIELEATDKLAILRVRDYGIGIAEDSQRRIFQRFERAVSGRTYSGFGLGLWITNEIVSAMGGKISVTSAPGEGTLFTIELPREPG